MTDVGGAADAYRRLAPTVLGYLRARRVPDAEDVLGEVFLQVARDLPRFRGDSEDDLRRWVMTIAHNRMADAARLTTTSSAPSPWLSANRRAR